MEFTRDTNYSATPTSGAHGSVKVFISYSRSDSKLVDAVVAGLEFDGGFLVTMDRNSTQEGELWRNRLAKLIEEADAIIFVVSERFLKSEICRWEAEEARSLSKRMLPILSDNLSDFHQLHWLGEIHSVALGTDILSSPEMFISSLSAIRRALVTDVAWLREHTRLLVRAREWEKADKAPNRLLFGPDIAGAESWLRNRPSEAPDPTQLHEDYLRASAEAEAERQGAERQRAIRLEKALRTAKIGLVFVCVFAIFASVAGYFARESSITANSERQQAQRTQSQLLADLSNRNLTQGDAGTGLLLALSALPNPDKPASSRRPYVPKAEASLFANLRGLREVRVITDVDSPIKAAGIYKNGKHLLVFSDEHGARIVDIDKGVLIQTLIRDPSDYSFASLPLQSGKFAMASDVGRVKVFDAKSGSETFEQVVPSVSALVLSGDGEKLAVGTEGGEIFFWNLNNSDVRRTISKQAGAISNLAISHNGDLLIASTFDGTALSFRLAADVQVRELANHDTEITSVAISADGEFALLSNGNSPAYLVSTTSGKLVGRYGSKITSIDFVPDSPLFLTGNSAGLIQLWRIGRATPIDLFLGHNSSITKLAHSATSSRFVSTSGDGTARVWDPQQRILERSVASHQKPTQSVAFATTNPLLASASTGEIVKILSGDHYNQVKELRVPSVKKTSISLSSDGNLLAIGFSDSVARLWDTKKGNLISEIVHNSPITSVALSSDGGLLVTGSEDRTARVWSVETGSLITSFAEHPGSISSVDITTDGSLVAVGSGSSGRVWSVQTGKLVHKFVRHRGSVYVVRFNADGSLLVTGSRDRLARVWDVSSRELVVELVGHNAPIIDATFSPAGNRIATVGSDGGVYIWDVPSATVIADLTVRGDPGRGARINGEGRLIAVGHDSGKTVLWRMSESVPELIRFAREIVPRCYSKKQREAFHLHMRSEIWCKK